MDLPTREASSAAVDTFDTFGAVGALTDDPTQWRDLLAAVGTYLHAMREYPDREATRECLDGLAAIYSDTVEMVASYGHVDDE